MDPKTMARMMKQMGIKTTNLDALEVKIILEDKTIDIKNPDVVKMTMKGNDTFQISGGTVSEEEQLSSEDIDMVVEKTGCSKEKAATTLKESDGDIAEAILKIEDNTNKE